MEERRAKVKEDIKAGLTKQGSGRSCNLATAIQKDQWKESKQSGVGKLNPHWVATLMGYPPLWCELGRKLQIARRSSKPSETQSSPSVQ
jgi:hypothetical protein